MRSLGIILAFGFGIGSVSFAVGFFGPIMWAPEANQGPLLGIFITGPLGFVAGCLIGAVVVVVKKLKKKI